MASTINASTTGGGGVITTADASGTLALQANGTTVATLNSTGINAGIQVAANAAPAFSAYASAVQTLTNATYTKIAFNTKTFDTNTNFDTTNYRFTPTVAGYYQLNGVAQIDSTGNFSSLSVIYKNGSAVVSAIAWGGSDYPRACVSVVVYANGTTDYFDLYTRQDSGVSKNLAAAFRRLASKSPAAT